MVGRFALRPRQTDRGRDDVRSSGWWNSFLLFMFIYFVSIGFWVATSFPSVYMYIYLQLVYGRRRGVVPCWISTDTRRNHSNSFSLLLFSSNIKFCVYKSLVTSVGYHAYVMMRGKIPPILKWIDRKLESIQTQWLHWSSSDLSDSWLVSR